MEGRRSATPRVTSSVVSNEPTRSVDLEALANDWLAVKRIGSDSVHSDRARQVDLRRWAGVFNRVTGNEIDPELLLPAAGQCAWSFVTVTKIDDETLLKALSVLRSELSVQSVQRMLTTFRQWAGWMVRRGVIGTNPTDQPEAQLRVRRDMEVRTCTEQDVAALLEAAREPSERVRTDWPARDVAIIETLTTCGLRAEELSTLTINMIDRTTERPLLRIKGKGGKRRNVPLPHRTLATIDTYLNERRERSANLPTLTYTKASTVFVKNDGAPIHPPFLYSRLEQIGRQADVVFPTGALVHALRHHYATQLTKRNVPLPIIQQLLGHQSAVTTAIYTHLDETDLTDSLHDAGWL